MDVAERGRLSVDIRQAYTDAHQPPRQRVAPPAEAAPSKDLEPRLAEAERRLDQAEQRYADAERRLAALESVSRQGAPAQPAAPQPERRKLFGRRS